MDGLLCISPISASSKVDFDHDFVLRIAVHSGDMKGTRDMLDLGADPNAQASPNENPLLLLATTKGYISIAKMLIAYGADIKKAGPTGDTVLHSAAATGNLEMMAMLLDAGGRTFVNTTNKYGSTPLHSACIRSSPKIIALLYQNGADLDAADFDGKSALHATCARGIRDNAKLLISLGCKINLKTVDSGWTALFWAVYLGSCDLVQMLLEHGADANAVSKKIESPLYCAVSLPNCSAICAALLKYGADVNFRNGMQGRTALQQAVAAKNLNLVSLLLKHDAFIDDVSNDGKTALSISCSIGYVEAIYMLVRAGAVVDFCEYDKNNRSVMFSALLSENTMIANVLLELGADINHRSVQSQTILHIALEENPRLTSSFIQLGVNIHAQTDSGESALDIASRKGLNSSIEVLLAAGFKITARNNRDGSTALHAACTANKMDTAALLVSKGSDPNDQRIDGYSALHIAAAACNVELIIFLLQAGADVMARTANGCNILHLVARHADIAENLLDEIIQRRSNIQELYFQQNEDGQTPLHIACISGNIKLIRCIYFARYQEARVQDGLRPLRYKRPFIKRQ